MMPRMKPFRRRFLAIDHQQSNQRDTPVNRIAGSAEIHVVSAKQQRCEGCLLSELARSEAEDGEQDRHAAGRSETLKEPPRPTLPRQSRRGRWTNHIIPRDSKKQKGKIGVGFGSPWMETTDVLRDADPTTAFVLSRFCEV